MDPATLLATALALAAFGTGGDVTSTTTTVDPVIDDPIVLTVSGGKVGAPSERIVIAANGSAFIRNGDGPRLEFSVPPRELRSVNAAADVAFSQGSEQLPALCLDCSLYEIRRGTERLSFDAVGYDRSAFSRNLVGAIVDAVPPELTR